MARHSILYFDDEQKLLDIFKEMFSNEYEVRTAATLTEAQRILHDCATDIIISDQLMPEIEGTEFLRQAAQICPDSFRIMLTGHAGLGQMLPEISSGIIQLFVVKPWEEEQMRQLLERASSSLVLRPKK